MDDLSKLGKSKQTFIAATKRQFKGTSPSAVEILTPLDNVEFKGTTTNPDQVIIEATEAAAEGIRQDHGDRLHLESIRPTFSRSE